MILLLPHLSVQAANAAALPGFIGAPPVMAAVLFAHNLGLKVGAAAGGVALLHHDRQLLGEWDRQFPRYFRPQQRRGAVFIDGADYSSKNKNALSLQPTASCHLRLSLLIELDDDISREKIRHFLFSARLAGGPVIRHGDPQSFDSLDEAQEAIRRLRGHWITDRRDLLAGAADPLRRLVEILGTRPPKATREEAAESLSWIVPTTVGYAAISAFTERRNVRQDAKEDSRYLHAFAEPVIGLVQYVSQGDHGDRPPPFWRHGWEDDVFLLKA